MKMQKGVNMPAQRMNALRTRRSTRLVSCRGQTRTGCVGSQRRQCEMPHGFATPFEAAMYLWLVLVMLMRRTANAEGLSLVLGKPSIFLLDISCFSAVLAVAFALVIAAMRCIAEDRLLVGEPGHGRVLRRDDFRGHVCCPVCNVFHGEKTPCQARGRTQLL